MRFAVLAALLALAACGSNESKGASGFAQPCAGAASRTWNAAGEMLIVSAMAVGEACATATAELKVMDERGGVLFQQSYPSEHVMSLAGAASAADLQTKLEQWIADAPGTTNTLPDWPAGAAQPMQGEFPFHPSEGVTRDAYLAARAAHAPMWCFVQGMESQTCLALRDGGVIDLGAQQFPG
jgi:hypothetical protein